MEIVPLFGRFIFKLAPHAAALDGLRVTTFQAHVPAESVDACTDPNWGLGFRWRGCVGDALRFDHTLLEFRCPFVICLLVADSCGSFSDVAFTWVHHRGPDVWG
jgi:hypothetical protein